MILYTATELHYYGFFCSPFQKIMDAIFVKIVDFGVKTFKRISDFEENLETVERNVKQLSDKAFDVKTEVQGREQSGKKKRKREVNSWFDEVIEIELELRSLKEEVTRGTRNAGALEKLNGRVGELLEQSKHFGMLVHDTYERNECLLLAPQVHEETSKQNLELIWTWLHVENVSSIGIYGMGGVGKMTLAKHIHNRLVNEIHYQVCWVTVSQGFSFKRLQDDLAKIVNLDLSDEVDEHRRAAKLNRAFKERKNIVIILDDVWDCLSLEKLGDPLGVEGCRLILTTRSYEVCLKIGCKKLLEVKKLNNYDAWELFRKSLRCETMLNPDIESIAKSMAGRCKGLPLGLITLAGSMKGVTDKREWKNALKEFPDDMESDVFKVMQYSYDQLKDKIMQECFLYCALYPEDCTIDGEKLVGRFIMEGLVKGNSRQEEFNQGHTILNKLVKVCLLKAVDGDYELGQAVKMHDLLREMVLRITYVKPRYMVRAGIRSPVPEEHAPNCPKLSTLLLPGCCLRRIPESFFQHMNNLQVLNLSFNSELMDLPSCVSNLGSLRAISLRECRELKSVPPLGKLKNLRVLDLSGTDIKEVPQGMGSLVKLTYLDMSGIYLDELPKELLPKLSHLQYLNLPLCLTCKIKHCDDIEWIVNVPSGRNTTTDPHCIRFHMLSISSLPNLIGLCKGKIASHVPCDTFSGLAYLYIERPNKIKKLFPRAILQDLENLQKLGVTDCDEMEEIIAEEATEQDGTSSDILILPKLMRLELTDLPKLKRICEGKLICDSLESMSFEHCSELKRLPFYAPTTNAHPFLALHTIKVLEKDWWQTLEGEQSHLKTLFQPHITHVRY
ncbi:probable disease resistance protein At1g61300 [Lycium ferocissimum]|uniref:probable disease resistance protein At1g61300 n=1 Tax=Lycium ferocissimum TaxID=112874 RepID=UPI0028165C9A|nr:probable disease resistance protein At1g61300 [Lycium ferocissimum]